MDSYISDPIENQNTSTKSPNGLLYSLPYIDTTAIRLPENVESKLEHLSSIYSA